MLLRHYKKKKKPTTNALHNYWLQSTYWKISDFLYTYSKHFQVYFRVVEDTPFLLEPPSGMTGRFHQVVWVFHQVVWVFQGLALLREIWRFHFCSCFGAGEDESHCKDTRWMNLVIYFWETSKIFPSLNCKRVIYLSHSCST